jgi:peptidoglycan/LPS O-acetylase OafA/YrhL
LASAEARNRGGECGTGPERHGMKAADHGIPQLDGLRFTAALLVMIAHSAFNPAAIPNSLLHFIYSSAGIGLSLFFVLSGFVIHYGYHEAIALRGGLSTFAIARFARLYPLYFAVLLYEILTSGAVSAMISGSAPEKTISLLFVGTLTHSWWYGVLGSNNLIFQWGDSTAAAWSISAELAMYMVYPAICIATHRLSSLRSNIVLMACICVGQLLFCNLLVLNKELILNSYQSVFGSVIKEASSTDTADQFFQWLLNYSPGTRFGQFALGVAAANIFIDRRRRELLSSWCASVRITPGLILLTMAAYWIVNSFYIYPSMLSVVYHGALNNLCIFSFFGAALIYLVASIPGAMTSRFFGSALMKRAGDATYATYLLHVPLLDYVNHNVVGLTVAGAQKFQAALRAGCLLLTYIFIVLIGYCIFRAFEAPARRWLRKQFSTTAIFAVIAGQFALFGIGVACVTYMQRAAALPLIGAVSP